MTEVKFIKALSDNSISEMQSIPKSDLHSHAGRGGSITYIEQWANVKIMPPTEPFNSLKEMNQWLNCCCGITTDYELAGETQNSVKCMSNK